MTGFGSKAKQSKAKSEKQRKQKQEKKDKHTGTFLSLPCSRESSASRMACCMLARSIGSGFVVVGGVGIVFVFGASMFDGRSG